MPARVEPVFRIINGRRTWPRDYMEKDREQAQRVAWRQLLRWVQAQMAMIDCGMVETAEVFSPYIVGPDGRTIWQVLAESQFRMLPAPEKAN